MPLSAPLGQWLIPGFGAPWRTAGSTTGFLNTKEYSMPDEHSQATKEEWRLSYNGFSFLSDWQHNLLTSVKSFLSGLWKKRLSQVLRFSGEVACVVNVVNDAFVFLIVMGKVLSLG